MDELLTRHGAVAVVLIRFRMACVGCPLARFETLESAAQNYGLEPELLRAEIRAAIAMESGAEEQLPDKATPAE